MCKYHIVFTPKYRRKIIYNQYKESMRDILKHLCTYKGVEILEGYLMQDRIHNLWSNYNPGLELEKLDASSVLAQLERFIDPVYEAILSEDEFWECGEEFRRAVYMLRSMRADFERFNWLVSLFYALWSILWNKSSNMLYCFVNFRYAWIYGKLIV